MSDEKLNEEVTHSVSPGVKLRQAREAVQLSVDDLAKKLYVKASEIEAIENDIVDSTKSLTFTKGYVKSYAKVVGLDVEVLSAEFDAYHNHAQENSRLQSFSKRVSKEANDSRWMMVTYLILLVIIGGMVWWWLQQPEAATSNTVTARPSSEVTEPINQSSSSAEQRQQSANITELSADSNGELETALIDEQNDTESTVQAIVSIEPENTDVLDTQSAGGTAIQEPDLEPLVSLPPQANNNEIAAVEISDTSVVQASDLVPVVFTFSQDCWVNIVDATGEAIAYGVKKAGRVMQIQGIPPFSVTLGAPNVVSIEYNGEAVDMSGFSGSQIGKLVLPLQS